MLHNDIAYHTDIARDFLILKDITETHKLPLIGPRTGGIDGLFHGPLWSWLNLPAFIIGNGDPVVIGWFWLLLVIASIGITYIVAKKVFDTATGIISAIIFSAAWVQYANSLYNPSGALIFSPLFFFFFYKYLKTLKGIYLALAFFIIGILIQFEVAFGGPILILATVYIAYFLFKKKHLKHILYTFAIIIPLSTYILFDVRHDFLQLRSILGSVGKPVGSGAVAFSQIIQNRLDGFINGAFQIPHAPLWFSVGIILLFIFVVYKAFKGKKNKSYEFCFIFAFFYLGYWPISLYLNGNALAFHYLPFLPIAIIVLASSYKLVRKEIYIIALIVTMFFTYSNAQLTIDKFNKETTVSAGSWTFNRQLATNLLSTAPKDFGYYVFTPDEWGYGPKYAMSFVSNNYPGVTATVNKKKAVTYLLMAPPLHDVEGNRDWWIKNKVRIKATPVAEKLYPNGYKVVKYALSKDEIAIPADPNLVEGLFFR